MNRFTILVMCLLLGTFSANAQFLEDFEGGLPSSWTVINNGSPEAWNVAAPSDFGATNSGTNVAQIDYNSTTAHDDYLITQQFTVTAGSSDEFRFFARNRSSFFAEEFDVLLSTSGTAPADFTNTIATAVEPPETSYQEYVYDLSAYVGQTVYIAFHITTLNEFAVYIDDVEARAIPSCQDATGVTATALSDTEVEVAWTDPNGTGLAQIEYGITGFSLGTGTTAQTGMGSPYIVDRLTPGTEYDFYVTAACSPTDAANPEGPVSAKTFPTAPPQGVSCTTGQPVFLFTEDFSNSTGWSGDIGTGGDRVWRFPHSGGTSSGSTGPDEAQDGIGGSYAYFESSTGSSATSATMVTPAIDLSPANGAAEISFYWHAYGSNIGTLEVRLSSTTTFPSAADLTIQGEFQSDNTDPWVQSAIDASAFIGGDLYIQFVYTMNATNIGSEFNADFAIDELAVEACVQNICLDVSNAVTSNITESSADIAFDDNSIPASPGFEVALVPAGDPAPTASGTNNTSTNSFAATGLMANTEYDVYVRADCQMAFPAVPALSFRTACPAGGFSAPYSSGFETGPLLGQEVCWSFLQITTDTNSQMEIDDDDVNTGNQAYQMRSGSDSSPDLILISPLLNDFASDKTISFFVYDEDNVGLEVGTMSDPTDETTFTVFTTLTEASLADDTWQQEFVDFSTYTGTDQYVAFRGVFSDTFDDIFIDDFEYYVTPSCLSPLAVTVSNRTTTTGDVSWNDPSGSGQANVIYGQTGFDPNTGGTTLQVTGTSTTISGLIANTSYDIYVQSDCSATSNGLSSLEGPVELRTYPLGPQGVSCTSGSPADLFTEDFSAQGGWTGDIGTGNQEWNFGETGDTGSTGTGPGDAQDAGGSYVYFEATSPPNGVSTNIMVSPAIDLSAATSAAELSFYYHAYGDGMGTLEVSLSSTTTFSGPADFIISGQYQTADTDPWIQVGVDASAFTGGDLYVQFAYTYDGTGNNFTADMAIDEMKVEACVANLCVDVSDIQISNINTTSADVTWTDNAVPVSTAWEVVVQPAGDPAPTAGSTNTSNTTFNATGLTSNTEYDVYVRPDCATTFAPPVTFRTACNPFGSFTENFDSVSTPDLPLCWSSIAIQPSSGTPSAVRTSTLADNSPSNGVQLYSGSLDGPIGSGNGDEGETILITPELSDLGNGTHRLVFFADAGTSTSTLEIGTMSDPTDPTTFNLIQAIAPTTTHVEYTVNFDTYTGTDGYIAFRHIFVGTFDSMYIDDITWEAIPACEPADNLSFSNVTDSSATVSWTDEAGSGEANVIYGLAGFDPAVPSTVIGTIPVSGASTPISGLIANTQYEFYVESDCTGSSNGLATLTGPIGFRTNPSGPQGVSCTTGAPAPIFTEDFSAQGGWTGDIGTGNREWQFDGTSGSTNTGPSDAQDAGGSYVYFETSGSTGATSGTMISPAIDLSGASAAAELSFYYHAYGINMGTLEVRLSSTTTFSGPADFTISGQYQTAETDPWIQVGIDASSFVGGDLYVEFTYTFDDQYSGPGNSYEADMAIDELAVETCVANFCGDVSNIMVSNVTDTTADISWTDNAVPASTAWEVVVQPAGDPVPTAGSTNATSTTFQATGLSEQTDYEVYIRPDCATTFAAPVAFTTPCSPVTAPYVETFPTDALPPCWVESGDNAWEYGNDVTNPTGQGDYGAEFVPDHTFNENGTFIFMDGSNNNDGEVSTITTAEVDLSTLTNPEVSYWVFSNNVDDDLNNILEVEFYDGAAWTLVETIQSNLGTDWVRYTVDLSSFTITGPVQLRFTVTAAVPIGGQENWFNDILIDDIAFKEAAFKYDGASWNTNPIGVSGMNDEVYVEAGTVQLTGALTTGLLSVSPGATLDLNGFDATVMGDASISGDVTGSGSVVMQGAVPQRISSPDMGMVSNLVIDNTNGVEVNPGQISVTEVLTLTDGDLATNDNLTLSSHASQTAMVAPLGATGTITGDVTVERYVPGKYVWRFLSPAANSSDDIRANWQNDGDNTPNLGIHITGSGGASNGFDPTGTNNPSMFTWDNVAQTWNPVTSTNTGTMTAGTPYRTFVRGDRTWDLTIPDPSTATPQPTVIQTTGTLETSAVTTGNMGDNVGDFGFVGNPYMAPVDMQTVLASSTNVNTGFYFVWDPTAGSQGAYTTYTFGSGNSLMGSNVDGTLRSSQAAFVEVSVAGGSSITFDPSDIVTSTTNIGVFSADEEPALMRLGVYAAGDDRSGVARDGVLVSFSPDGFNGLDTNDAGKLSNPDENLAVLIEGNKSSVSSMALPQHGDIIPLDMTGYTSSENTFVAELGRFEEGTTAYFVDGLTGERTELVQDARTEIPVQVDVNNAGSVNSRRFYIEFAKDGFAAEQFASQISMYPNPVTGDNLNLMLPRTDADAIDVKVVNLLGQTVLSRSIEKTGATATVSGMSRLETGVYIVTITDGNETATQRLVVK